MKPSFLNQLLATADLSRALDDVWNVTSPDIRCPSPPLRVGRTCGEETNTLTPSWCMLSWAVLHACEAFLKESELCTPPFVQSAWFSTKKAKWIKINKSWLRRIVQGAHGLAHVKRSGFKNYYQSHAFIHVLAYGHNIITMVCWIKSCSVYPEKVRFRVWSEVKGQAWPALLKKGFASSYVPARLRIHTKNLHITLINFSNVVSIPLRAIRTSWATNVKFQQMPKLYVPRAIIEPWQMSPPSAYRSVSESLLADA